MLKNLLRKKITLLTQITFLIIAVILVFARIISRSPLSTKFRFEFQVVTFFSWIIFVVANSKILLIITTNSKQVLRKSLTGITNLLLVISIFFLVFNNYQFLQYKDKVMCECNSTIVEEYGRYFIVGYNDFEEVKDLVENTAIGGIYISNRNVKGKTKEELRNEIAELQLIQKQNGLQPLMVAADHEGGYISDELHLTGMVKSTPSLRTLTSNENKPDDNDYERITEYAATHAFDLNFLGINTTFGPVVDLINTEINTPISQISDRAISSDPEITSDVALAYIKEMNNHGINTTIKALSRIR